MTAFSRRAMVMQSLAALSALGACAPQQLQPLVPEAGFSGPRFENGALVSFDGQRLPLNVWAPEDREPWAVIVAVHGVNDYAMAFEDDAKVFARAGVVTYAYDQRGFGRAPGRGLWAGEKLLTQDLRAAIFAARRNHPKAVLVVLGHSMGGAVAINALSGEDAPRVDRLVLAAPAVWGWSSQPMINRATLWLGAHLAPEAHLEPPRWLAEQHMASDNLPKLRQMGADRWMIFDTRIDVVYGLVDLMQKASVRIGQVSAPILYLYGAHDNFVPKRASLRAVRRLKPADRSAYYVDGWHLLLRDLHGDLVRGDILAYARSTEAVLPSGAPDVRTALTNLR